MVNISERIEHYEHELRAKGISLSEVLRCAGVNRSTWTRWKGIPSKPPQKPNLGKWEDAEGAIVSALESASQPIA